MADKKTSALTAVAAALGAQELPCNDAGTSKKVTLAQVKTALQAGGDIALALAGLSGLPLPPSILAANFTKNNATMAASGLTVNVVSGVRYFFRATLFLNDSSTATLAGARFDFDASTATATTFRAWPDDGAIGGFPPAFSTALATDILGSAFADDRLLIDGYFRPSSSGTFALRAAQQTVTDGQLTVYEGSSLVLFF